MSSVGIVGEIIDLLICRALCVCLADKGAALQVGNAPGYVLRFVGYGNGHLARVALCVVFGDGNDTGTEIYAVGLVYDADDLARPKLGERVPGQTVEVDSSNLIADIRLFELV